MADTTSFTPNPTETARRSFAWVLPLILLAALVIGYYIQSNRQNDGNSGTPAAQTETGDSQSNQSVSDLNNAAAGSSASLKGITIQKAIGSRIFTIGEAGGRSLYIILAAGAQLEDRTTLKEGQQVNISGTLMSPDSEGIKKLNLTQSEMQAIAGQSMVLVVDKIEIVNSTESDTQSNSETNNNDKR
jgi:hypothetical protein